jgi:hypothetical protein
MTKTTNSKTDLIKVVFTNLLFVLGVIMLLVGFITGTSTVAKLAFFERYPLNSYEETRCDAPYFTPAMPVDGASMDKKVELLNPEQQQADCKEKLEYDRRVRKTEDVVSAISFLAAGAMLTYIFKRFIFDKK